MKNKIVKKFTKTQDNVLILQGGGALGAYQAGVYEHLHENNQNLNWVIGTSIGAINSALIAGNKPEVRIERMKGFWDSLSPKESILSGFWSRYHPMSSDAMSTLMTIMYGVEGFFKAKPRFFLDVHAKIPIAEAGLYDTSLLKETLEKYVDFDYLNSGPTRITVCAVDIGSGEGVQFDSKKIRIEPEHIMASGALPPGFPAVVIDGRAYWDGGVYSNSPLEVFLDEERGSGALCFMVDLWNRSEPLPTTIAEGMSRYKSIQYASRSREELVSHQKIQNLQRAIRILGEYLPANKIGNPEIEAILDLGADHTVNVVHLTMRPMAGDQYFKDLDFSKKTIQARWKAGMLDCRHALKNKVWLNPLPPNAGLIIHELTSSPLPA